MAEKRVLEELNGHRLSESHARELLHLTATRISARRLFLEQLGRVEREHVSGSTEDSSTALNQSNDETQEQHLAMESFDGWAAELVSSLADGLNLPAQERQAALVALKQPPPPPDHLSTLDLLNAEHGERQKAAELLVAAMLCGACYDARERVVLRDVGFSGKGSLDLLPETMPLIERRIAMVLVEARAPLQAGKEGQETTDGSSSGWTLGKAGLALAGGVAVAMGGVMAAPLVAGGLGSLLTGVGLGGTSVATAAGALAGNSSLVGVLFGGFGAMQTKEMVDRASADVKGFEFVDLTNTMAHDKGTDDTLATSLASNPVSSNPLHTTIGIAGFLRSTEDATKPFSVLPPLSSPHALKYDPESLLAVGRIVDNLISSRALGYVKREVIKHTVLATLYSSLWPLGLLRYAAMLDNPFSHAVSMSHKAGVKLADTLIARKQGPGPVSIIATSLGATAAFTCLTELDSRGAYGLVDTVILCGSPVPTAASEWIKARRAVAGRLVNVYSTTDYLLAFLYRVVALSRGCAGVQSVGMPDELIDELDATEIVGSWHGGYQDHLGVILQKLGVEAVAEEVEKQEEAAAPVGEIDPDGGADEFDAFAPMGAEAGLFALKASDEGAVKEAVKEAEVGSGGTAGDHGKKRSREGSAGEVEGEAEEDVGRKRREPEG